MLKNTNCNNKVGIIDGNLSTKNHNITFSESTNFSSKIRTHGDEIISFIFNCQRNVEVYYFDATNDNGEIDTNKILNGLNWMLENRVDLVNISLSNTVKHKELENWILQHSEIKIFASYNNKLHSYDYPAMYNGVFASGSDSRIKYKDNDFRYNSNRIILLTNGFHIYNGNSYLSVLSMLKN